MMFNRHAILKHHYREEILGWNWEGLVERMQQACEHNDDHCTDSDGDRHVHMFIGTVFALTPSGKYYTFWTSNQTRSDCTRDEAWWEALEEVADSYECWIENGEGDPCDIFIVKSFPIPENEDEEDYPDTTDGDHASALASAGWGTDEDYGGGDERL